MKPRIKQFIKIVGVFVLFNFIYTNSLDRIKNPKLSEKQIFFRLYKTFFWDFSK